MFALTLNLNHATRTKGVPDSQFIPDIRIVDGEIGDHEVGCPLDILGAVGDLRELPIEAEIDIHAVTFDENGNGVYRAYQPRESGDSSAREILGQRGVSTVMPLPPQRGHVENLLQPGLGEDGDEQDRAQHLDRADLEPAGAPRGLGRGVGESVHAADDASTTVKIPFAAAANG